MKLLVSCLVASSFAFAGCAEPEDAPALEDTEQAVTAPFVTSSTCTSGSCLNLPIAGTGASGVQ